MTLRNGLPCTVIFWRGRSICGQYRVSVYTCRLVASRLGTWGIRNKHRAGKDDMSDKLDWEIWLLVVDLVCPAHKLRLAKQKGEGLTRVSRLGRDQDSLVSSVDTKLSNTHWYRTLDETWLVSLNSPNSILPSAGGESVSRFLLWSAFYSKTQRDKR